jgi:hypothetical protein
MKAKNVVQPVAVDPRTAVYHLKVHILNISPMIYRRFIVDGNTHIAELHHLIQMMMGWENQHLHVFHIWGVDYGIAYDGGLSSLFSSSSVQDKKVDRSVL